MIIISPFKDYYDFLVEKYGRDEKIIYNRGLVNETIFPTKDFYNIKPRFLGNLSVSFFDGIYNKPLGEKYNCAILVVCGKIYFLKLKVKDTFYTIDFWDKYSLLNPEDLEDDHLYNKLLQCFVTSPRFYFRKSKSFKKEIEEKLHGTMFDENFLNISYRIKNPIFLIKEKNHNNICISQKTPILKEIKGISGLLNPDDIYQDISYFIGNVLNQPKEEVKISNKSKILKAGFDLKTSFRNM